MYESYGTLNFVDNRFAALFEAVARGYLRWQVRDRDLRDKLTPAYRMGCKRAAVSSNYLPTFSKDNVELVTAAIDHIETDAIVTTDGRRHRVDTLVLATGFTLLNKLTENVIGIGGQSVAACYRVRPQSYLGVSMSGFPNLFVTSGPFAGAGNQSFLYMLEAQFAYIADALATMRERGVATFDVRPQVQADFVADAERRSADTIWLNGGCKSYYTTPDGKRNAGLWPDWSFNYRRRTRRFDADQYQLSTTAAEAQRADLSEATT
jgi:cation diffusion facilitator CzcD-associated flavoprotein CzcO